MITCATCGNDFQDEGSGCPFCGETQNTRPPGARAAARQKEIVILNIKEARATVDEALARLDGAVKSARDSGIRALKIIHGYGSGGKGGAIRPAARARLERYRAEGLLRAWIPGESFSRHDPLVRRWVHDFPHFKDDEAFDRRNEGITFVIF
jgi:hypothetical protein